MVIVGWAEWPQTPRVEGTKSRVLLVIGRFIYWQIPSRNTKKVNALGPLMAWMVIVGWAEWLRTPRVLED